MSPLVMVLGLLAAAVVMFAINRPRMDVVAVLMMLLLPLTGVITMPEALAGLSDPNVVLIAALFVIGEALVRTGVAQRLGDWLTSRAGGSEPRLIALLMLVVAGVGLLIDQPTGDVDLARFACDHQLTLLPVSGEWFADTAQEIGMAQLIVPPTSRLIGQTAIAARFRTAYDLSLLAAVFLATSLLSLFISNTLTVAPT